MVLDGEKWRRFCLQGGLRIIGFKQNELFGGDNWWRQQKAKERKYENEHFALTLIREGSDETNNSEEKSLESCFLFFTYGWIG